MFLNNCKWYCVLSLQACLVKCFVMKEGCVWCLCWKCYHCVSMKVKWVWACDVCWHTWGHPPVYVFLLFIWWLCCLCVCGVSLVFEWCLLVAFAFLSALLYVRASVIVGKFKRVLTFSPDLFACVSLRMCDFVCGQINICFLNVCTRAFVFLYLCNFVCVCACMSVSTLARVCVLVCVVCVCALLCEVAL